MKRSTKLCFKNISEFEKKFLILWQIYSTPDNETPPISRVMIRRHLIFCLLTSPPCCKSHQKCTPHKHPLKSCSQIADKNLRHCFYHYCSVKPMPGLFCQAKSVAGNTRSGRKIIVVARWTMFLKLVFQSYVEKTGGNVQKSWK